MSSDNRKRHRKTIAPQTTPPRIPAPQSWTSEEALGQYVYVLLPQHCGMDNESGVLFYARCDQVELVVTVDILPLFLAEYAGRTWITCDAVGLFDVCMEACIHSPQNRSFLWQLLRDCRLWDVVMLARRIHFAETGQKMRCHGESYHDLCEKYGVTTESSWEQLQSLFCGMIQRAVTELPIFQTYWNLGYEVDGVRQDGFNLPRPLTTEEFGRLWYLRRYAEKQRHKYHSTDTCDPEGQSCLEEVDYPSHYFPLVASAFRRRDLLLCSPTGPLGIGLDCQAAVVAEQLNRREHGDGVAWNDNAKSHLEHLRTEASRRLGVSRLRTGFRREDSGATAFDKKGFVRYVNNELRTALTKLWADIPTFVMAELTYPVDADGHLSIRYEDWLDYIHLDGSVRDWVLLETTTTALRLHGRAQLPKHLAFPTLASPVTEGLSLIPDLAVFQTTSGHSLLTLDFQKLETVAFVLTFFSEHLLHKAYPEDSYAELSGEYFASVVNRIQEDLRHTDRKPPKTRETDYTQVAQKFEKLTPDQREQAVNEIAMSFMRLEHADTLRGRMQRHSLDLRMDQLDILYWLTIKHLFSALMPIGQDVSFFQIPRINTPETRRVKLENEIATLEFVNLNVLMLRMMALHFMTKCEMYNNEFFASSFNLARYGWSVVNWLFEEDYASFFRHTEGDEFEEFRSAASRLGEIYVKSVIPFTNAVSITGRIGPPIWYFEQLLFDSRQLAEDLRTTVAFSLLRENLNVISTTRQGITICVSDTDTTSAESTVTAIARHSLQHFLRQTFPANTIPGNVLEQLLVECVICTKIK